MQIEIEKWIEENKVMAHTFGKHMVPLNALRALLSRFVLCDAEPVACERCKGQGAVMDTIRLPGGGTVQSVADCDACNATGTLYAPASLEGNADIGKPEPDYSKPPCQRCGAMTQAEAEQKCKVAGGDDDNCHGCELWPHDADIGKEGGE
jgi:hypothetical protein